MSFLIGMLFGFAISWVFLYRYVDAAHFWMFMYDMRVGHNPFRPHEL